MGSLNKVCLIGNLGKDPELRYTKNQRPYCRFSLATTEEWTDQSGQRQKNTQWHNVIAWGKQAEVIGRYLNKGRQVYIEGSIEYREYDDQNGQRRNITDIRLNRFVFLSGQGGGGGRGGYDNGPGRAEPQPGGYGGGGQSSNFGGGGQSSNFGGGQSSNYGGGQQPANYGAPAPSPAPAPAPAEPAPMNYGSPTQTASAGPTTFGASSGGPQTYGSPMSPDNVPESDNFDDDDIPF